MVMMRGCVCEREIRRKRLWGRTRLQSWQERERERERERYFVEKRGKKSELLLFL
jgi:hypothetical protein